VICYNELRIGAFSIDAQAACDTTKEKGCGKRKDEPKEVFE